MALQLGLHPVLLSAHQEEVALVVDGTTQNNPVAVL